MTTTVATIIDLLTRIANGIDRRNELTVEQMKLDEVRIQEDLNRQRTLLTEVMQNEQRVRQEQLETFADRSEAHIDRMNDQIVGNRSLPPVSNRSNKGQS